MVSDVKYNIKKKENFDLKFDGPNFLKDCFYLCGGGARELIHSTGRKMIIFQEIIVILTIVQVDLFSQTAPSVLRGRPAFCRAVRSGLHPIYKPQNTALASGLRFLIVNTRSAAV
jgi:hypothetical protein